MGIAAADFRPAKVAGVDPAGEKIVERLGRIGVAHLYGIDQWTDLTVGNQPSQTLQILQKWKFMTFWRKVSKILFYATIDLTEQSAVTPLQHQSFCPRYAHG